MFKTARQFYRLLYIQYVFSKYGLDAILVELPWFRPVRYVKYLNPWNWSKKTRLKRGDAIRRAIQDLGPIFIKFGQAMSTRPDVLPEDIAMSLAQLQDNVPAFESELAVEKLEDLFETPISELFAEFEVIPLASASIAQVHAATLHDGRAVVVKILRPGVRKQITEDLAIMKRIAHLIEHYWVASRRLKPSALVDEFETHLLDELDLRRESANAIQLRRNFLNSTSLYVPEVMWDYTKEEVLVMERIYGIPVSDRAKLNEVGVNIPKLAEKGVEVFFTQVFENSFFHADMHPGNIFVSFKDVADPSYICVDFGLMGSLSDSDQRYLAYNLYAFFNRDYRRVAQLHIECGWVAKTTRVEEFESAIRTVCEPIFERPFSQISFAHLVVHLFQTAKNFQMEVQPQLILLQKTLLAVEGLGKQLYPDLDLWKTGKPFLERWLRSRVGVKVFWNELKSQLPFLVEQLPHLPHLLYDVLEINKTLALHVHQQMLAQEARREKGMTLSGKVAFAMLMLVVGAGGAWIAIKRLGL
ncbi:MAG: ubiquinone biosynthesis regulatory protein kinase UbiB [Gammaproteobacteria bacterium]|nr:ubiquinone biosynthesis regulatory protein kinase UbiB [Gammaproteobacteria bacterium]